MLNSAKNIVSQLIVHIFSLIYSVTRKGICDVMFQDIMKPWKNPDFSSFFPSFFI